ncbi:hypothetical protein ykris0001_46320 [Yersinia kristensenii ATCC 33638]|nr:hypothetical protein ykris0001_46320 [Yersinia kristensenii ATCC 33638]
MLSSLTILAKSFIEKSSEQFMVTVVIWSVILIFVPDNFRDLINAKIGIPYALQICSFAVAFTITLILKYIFQIALALLPDVCDRHRASGKAKKINRVIDQLTDEERYLLSFCLAHSNRQVIKKINNHVARSLVSKGILFPPAFIPKGNSEIIFTVSLDYWPYLQKRWDILAQKLK